MARPLVYPRTMDAMLPAVDRLSQGQAQGVKLAMTAAPVAGLWVGRQRDQSPGQGGRGGERGVRGDLGQRKTTGFRRKGGVDLPGPAGRGLRAS